MTETCRLFPEKLMRRKDGEDSEKRLRGKGTKKSFYQNTVEKRDKFSSLLRRYVRSKVKNILSLRFTLGHKQIYMEYKNE